MTPIKPCPFDGAPAYVYEAWGLWGVECSFCKIHRGEFDNPESAIQSWNKRVEE